MVALGLKTVVTAGTKVQLSTTSIKCNFISFQPLKSGNPKVANTGSIYIGYNNMNRNLSAGVVYVLDAGVPAVTMQGRYGADMTDDVSNYWVDADTSGDGVLVSYA